MELWQIATFTVGGALLLLYFKRRAARLSKED